MCAYLAWSEWGIDCLIAVIEQLTYLVCLDMSYSLYVLAKAHTVLLDVFITKFCHELVEYGVLGSKINYGSHTNINRIKYDGKKNPYDESINKCEMVNNTSGSVVGYKYFNFRKTFGKDNLQLLLDITKEGVGGTIDVYIDRPNETDGGVKIGTLAVEAQTDKKPVNVSVAVPNLKNYNGKHALFLVFTSPTKEKSICTVNSLQFK